MTTESDPCGTLVKNQTHAVAHTLKAEGHDASEDGTGRGVPLIPCGIDGGEVGYSLRANPSRSGDKGDGGVNCTLAVAGVAPTIKRDYGKGYGDGEMDGGGLVAEQVPMAVRRLTPRECERLQGFPDDYTLIPWRGKTADECPDGPRYKALGNSMAVPVMRWIGQRIAQVDAIIKCPPFAP